MLPNPDFDPSFRRRPESGNLTLSRRACLRLPSPPAPSPAAAGEGGDDFAERGFVPLRLPASASTDGQKLISVRILEGAMAPSKATPPSCGKGAGGWAVDVERGNVLAETASSSLACGSLLAMTLWGGVLSTGVTRKAGMISCGQQHQGGRKRMAFSPPSSVRIRNT